MEFAVLLDDYNLGSSIRREPDPYLTLLICRVVKMCFVAKGVLCFCVIITDLLPETPLPSGT